MRKKTIQLYTECYQFTNNTHTERNTTRQSIPKRKRKKQKSPQQKLMDYHQRK